MMNLLNVLEDATENSTSITMADIVILVVLGVIILILIAYFSLRKMKGKSLTGCDCGGSGKKLLKAYKKKYKKEEKHCCCCSEEEKKDN